MLPSVCAPVSKYLPIFLSPRDADRPACDTFLGNNIPCGKDKDKVFSTTKDVTPAVSATATASAEASSSTATALNETKEKKQKSKEVGPSSLMIAVTTRHGKSPITVGHYVNLARDSGAEIVEAPTEESHWAEPNSKAHDQHIMK